MAEIEIAKLGVDDVDAIAKIHAVAFPDAAITAFGDETIRRYYRWLLQPVHDAAIVGAKLGGRLLGYCAAGVFRGAMNGFLRRNRLFLLSQMLRHPRLLTSELVRSRVRTALGITVRFSRLRTPTSAPSLPSFGILSIAVDPKERHHRVGHLLMTEAETRARAQGFGRMTLTVHPSNTGAVAFYERRGWQRDASQQPWNGAMTLPLSVVCG